MLGVLGIVWRFGVIICLSRADVRAIANCTEDVQTVELDSGFLFSCVVRHICTCHVLGSFCQAASGQTRPGLGQAAAWLTHCALAKPVSTGWRESALHRGSASVKLRSVSLSSASSCKEGAKAADTLRTAPAEQGHVQRSPAHCMQLRMQCTCKYTLKHMRNEQCSSCMIRWKHSLRP